jgi:hypothetical protein
VEEILVGQGRQPPPPPPSQKIINFRKFLPKRGLKTAYSSANRGVCRKFESFVRNFGSFVRNFGRFAPPPEKVNFRHWLLDKGPLLEM